MPKNLTLTDDRFDFYQLFNGPHCELALFNVDLLEDMAFHYEYWLSNVILIER